MSLRGWWSAFLLAPLLLVSEGTARAEAPTSYGAGLRPFIHTDRYGRTLVDVCPERTPGGRRCFSQRVLRPGDPLPVPFSGGGSCFGGGGGGGTSPPKGAMTPSDVLTLYDIPSAASAKGAIVALVDLSSTNAMTDVNTYRTEFGIPTLPACPLSPSGVPTPGGTACFARVGTDGTVNTLSTTDCPGWAGETALDMDMVSAACPDCSIVVVEAADAYGSDLDQEDPVAATVLAAAAVSNSWGAPESGFDDQAYYMSPGILTVAASGDDGYLMEDIGVKVPDFPASSPYVLAVGGTTLYSSDAEVVWDDDAMGGGGSTTSGCSTEFAMPTYQSTSGFNFGTCKMRATVDVSAAAEFRDGSLGGAIAVYVTDDGGWNAYVGTSASSPLVAAIMVRLGLAGTDNHTLFYQNGGAFNDITSGNNDHIGICTDIPMCTAGPQWDGPTGLGSPNGTLLLALAGGTLEPEPDAGPPDSGPPDTGGGVDSGFDSGSPSDSGSEASQPPRRGIGSPCSGAWQCAGQSLCVSPTPGKPSVCAPACDGAQPCPVNYACQSGFCFAGKSTSDAGSEDKDQAASSSGCACSAGPSDSPGTAAGWLVSGVLLWARRRRRRPSVPHRR